MHQNGMLTVGGKRAMYACLLSAGLVGAVGCGGRPSLDESAARRALEASLAAWKADQTPESMQQHDPPVTVVDDAWSSGRKLIDYAIVGEPKSDGQNLRCYVELTMPDRRGQPQKQKVPYIIGTDPVITVFRHDE